MVPTQKAAGKGAFFCSPRTRGWSHADPNRHRSPPLLPAHAGMVPSWSGASRAPSSAPRARGDGPHPAERSAVDLPCSPRTRGWSRPRRRADDPRPLLPAHAGMVPRPPGRRWQALSAPRARGDGPGGVGEAAARDHCSPRTRGWSQEQVGRLIETQLLPAHAGMVPRAAGTAAAARTAPRARGDGPAAIRRIVHEPTCSPRTRGWSRGAGTQGAEPGLLPAHAGMVPVLAAARPERQAAPRARGDGPTITCRSPGMRFCSPRTRGWSPGDSRRRPGRPLLPAHAGMVRVRPGLDAVG